MPQSNKTNFASKTVVAIGKFDGMHIGHRELLLKAKDIARKEGFISVALLINSSFSTVLHTKKDRENIIKSLGIDYISSCELTHQFMSMTPNDFVNEILIKKYNAYHVVVGYNFRFAKDRCADANILKTLCADRGIECTVIDKVICNTACGTLTASSTNVRKCLLDGDIKSANDILGTNYTLSGKVICGNKIGRTLGFPTANISVEDNIFLPKNGVYFTKVFLDGKYIASVTNIGDNPTVNQNGNITIETHIIDYSGDLYDKDITVEFIEKIRDEKKFASFDELKKQINNDIKSVSNKL